MNRMETAASLLPELRRYLAITWQDGETDQSLTEYLQRGMAYLCDRIGAPDLDFQTEGMIKALLLDYCRYARSQALEMFAHNFRTEILSMRLSVMGAGGKDTGDEN